MCLPRTNCQGNSTLRFAESISICTRHIQVVHIHAAVISSRKKRKGNCIEKSSRASVICRRPIQLQYRFVVTRRFHSLPFPSLFATIAFFVASSSLFICMFHSQATLTSPHRSAISLFVRCCGLCRNGELYFGEK